ncbi:MAG: GDYXXLXY domain-containing protein [Leptospiraceae bacterium]|nr:GDYXXLXY domain-containing protein [Leptospiraceae bacterium]MDW8306557.1 GDYXXLXY domain-containing protein [Leptospiraceae bacterium]
MARNRLFLWLAIGTPYGILSFFFFKMAYPLVFGQEVVFEAEKSESRDYLIGDYLNLKYDFTFYDFATMPYKLAQKKYHYGDVLYILFDLDRQTAYARSKLLTDEKPHGEIYLRVHPRYSFELADNTRPQAVAVELVSGLENYYVSPELIRELASVNKFGVRVRISPDGHGRIVGLAKQILP